jgi:uncharacterized membrane protein
VATQSVSGRIAGWRHPRVSHSRSSRRRPADGGHARPDLAAIRAHAEWRAISRVTIVMDTSLAEVVGFEDLEVEFAGSDRLDLLGTALRIARPDRRRRRMQAGWDSMVGVNSFRSIALVAATLTMGLMAGAFGLYSHTIMPALRRTDDRTFVGAFQSMDRAIINPWFMPAFLGALVLTALAAALCLGPDGRAALPWVLVALALYLVTFVITIGINVPLNDTIKAAGHPDRIADLAAVRHQFDEARWAAWNHIRTVATTVGFGSLAIALLRI